MRLSLAPRLPWARFAQRYLPFADAASADLPLPRLLRLALFQVSVGMATVLMLGTLNRVMIVELGVGAWLVALMVGLPFLVAPWRAWVGLKSDLHRSAIGWRRVPFIWFGTMAQFGGLAIMPFALILLSGAGTVQLVAGHVAAALAFLLVGAGLQVTQTAGLALATDLAPAETRPRVVALMYVMLLIGMVGCGFVYSFALADYTHTRLVQVVQGTAVATVLLNLVALWKQEPRRRAEPSTATATTSAAAEPAGGLRLQWHALAARERVGRFLLALGLGTAAFSMQDIILEPYGAEVLGLTVAATTLLTALSAAGALVAFALAARALARSRDPMWLAACGVLVGLAAFCAVIFAEPLASPALFRTGAFLIGLGGGLFAVGCLSAAMAFDAQGLHGMVLGAFGAMQAVSAGLATAAGGMLRDLVSTVAAGGALGEAMADASAGYAVVYHTELLLLFATLVVLGPLARRAVPVARAAAGAAPARMGLAQLPG